MCFVRSADISALLTPGQLPASEPVRRPITFSLTPLCLYANDQLVCIRPARPGLFVWVRPDSRRLMHISCSGPLTFGNYSSINHDSLPHPSQSWLGVPRMRQNLDR